MPGKSSEVENYLQRYIEECIQDIYIHLEGSEEDRMGQTEKLIHNTVASETSADLQGNL